MTTAVPIANAIDALFDTSGLPQEVRMVSPWCIACPIPAGSILRLDKRLCGYVGHRDVLVLPAVVRSGLDLFFEVYSQGEHRAVA